MNDGGPGGGLWERQREEEKRGLCGESWETIMV